MKSTLLKLCAYVVGIALTLAAVLAGWGWYTLREGASDAVRWLSDPALTLMAGDGPPELKGLSRRIHQFTHLNDAIAMAHDAGFECERPAQGSIPSDYTGPHTLVCPRKGQALKAGSEALVLRSWHPHGAMRAMELRRWLTAPPSPVSSAEDPAGVAAQALEQAPLIAAARGIEFGNAEQLADLVADRFDAYFHSTCVGDDIPHASLTACQEFRQRRSAQGLPKWNGQALKAGTHVDALRILRELRLECGPAGFRTPADRVDNAGIAGTVGTVGAVGTVGTAAAETSSIVCETRAFSGQVQSVTLETDARSAIPQAYVVSTAGASRRLPLSGTAPANDDPDATSVLVNTLLGETQVLTMSLRNRDGSLDRAIKLYPRLNPGSQQRVMGAIVLQTQSLLAAPNAPPALPQLQRLDVAAARLVLFGADAVTLASREMSSLQAETQGVIALASCRLGGQTADCLMRFTITLPSLHGLLTAALAEANDATPPLAPEHPVRWRLMQLAVQLKTAAP